MPIIGLTLLIASLVFCLAGAVATIGGTVTSYSIDTYYNGWKNCAHGLIDGVFAGKPITVNGQQYCHPLTGTQTVNEYFDIQLLNPTIIETILTISREDNPTSFGLPRIQKTDFWVGMDVNSLIACNAYPQGSGLTSCGGLKGLHLRVRLIPGQATFINIGEIRAYSIPPTTGGFTLTSSPQSTCVTGVQNLFQWPANTLVVNTYTTCRQALAGGSPAYYQVDFPSSRYVHAITVLGQNANSIDTYKYSRNWKLSVLINTVYTIKGQWQSLVDDYGKEIAIGASTTSLRIERADGVELRFFWVGIFLDQSECTGTFDWSETQSQPIKLNLQTTVFTVHAKNGSNMVSHRVVQLQTTTPAITWTYDPVSQILTFTPPLNVQIQLQLEVSVWLSYDKCYQTDSRTLNFDVCTVPVTIAPTSVSLTQEIAEQQVSISLPSIAPSVSTTLAYQLDSTAPSFFQLSGSSIIVDAAAIPGTYAFGIIVTEQLCLTKTSLSVTVQIYDCAVTGFVLHPATIAVEVLGSTQIVTWTKDLSNSLCGDYEIFKDPSFLPLLTVDVNELDLKAIAPSQRGVLSLPIKLQRQQNTSQSATVNLTVTVYCKIQALTFTQLADQTEIMVGLDKQPVVVPFKVDLPCFEPATFVLSENQPFSASITNLTECSGDISISKITGLMHGVYQLKLTAVTSIDQQSQYFKIFVNGCLTSTFVHQQIPSTDVFKQGGTMTGSIRFNEFQHTLGLLAKDCGKTNYKIMLVTGQQPPSWISLDQESKLINYDLSAVGIPKTYSFQLQASLEQYPTVSISESFNITIASSEIICNRLPQATYHIGDPLTVYKFSYSNQTFASANTRLMKVIQPIIKRQGVSIPMPSFIQYTENKFQLFSKSFEDMNSYTLGLRIGYEEFPSFQIVCEMPLTVDYQPKFVGDKIEDQKVNCDKPWSFTIPTYTDSEKQLAQLAIDLGQASSVFEFDISSRSIKSDPANIAGISQTFSVNVTLTDSHEASSFFAFNLDVYCSVYQETPVRQIQLPKLVLPRPLPEIQAISNTGLVKVSFSRKLKLPTYDEYPELDPKANCTDNCRMLQNQNDESQAIQIINQAKVSVNGALLPFMDIQIIPGRDSNITNLAFDWNCTMMKPEIMTLQLNFQRKEVVSMFTEREKIVVYFNGYKYLQAEDGQTLPPQASLYRSLPPQIDNKIGQFLSIFGQAVAQTTKAILVLQFILKLLISQSLQQVFGAINKLQVMIHLHLTSISVASNAWMFFASLVSLVNFEVINVEPLSRKMFALNNDKPFSEGFEDFGYSSKYLIINLGTLFYALIIMLTGLMLVPCLSKASHPRILKVRDKLREDLVWGGFIDYFNESYLVICLSCLIAYSHWTPKNFGEGVDQVVACAFAIIIISVPLVKGIFLYRNCNKLGERDLREKFGPLYDQLRFKRTRWALLEPIVTDCRRLALTLTLVLLKGYSVVQLMIIDFMILAILIFNSHCEPYADRSTHRLEQFNELTILGILIHLMCFADFVIDPQMRMNIGWSMIATVSSTLAINFGIVSFGMITGIRSKVRFYLLRRKLAKRMQRRLRIDQERERQLLRYYEDQKREEIEEMGNQPLPDEEPQQRFPASGNTTMKLQKEQQTKLPRQHFLQHEIQTSNDKTGKQTLGSEKKLLTAAKFKATTAIRGVPNAIQNFTFYLPKNQPQPQSDISNSTFDQESSKTNPKNTRQNSALPLIKEYSIDIVTYPEPPIDPKRNVWRLDGRDFQDLQDDYNEKM